MLCRYPCVKHQLGVPINILFCAIYSVYCIRQSQSIDSSLYTLECVMARNVDLFAAVTCEVGRERACTLWHRLYSGTLLSLFRPLYL